MPLWKLLIKYFVIYMSLFYVLSYHMNLTDNVISKIGYITIIINFLIDFINQDVFFELFKQDEIKEQDKNTPSI